MWLTGSGRCRILAQNLKYLIMEMFGNIRCVTFAELVTQGGILSEPNYKKKVREGKIRPLTIGGNGRKVLIDYVSLYKPIKDA